VQSGTVSGFPLRREGIRPLAPTDLPLIFLAHNDRRFIPSFLKHYRGLGVTRFLCLDDQSTDGTREILATQPDVDVFRSNVRYRDAWRGRLWREALLAMHGDERWYLNLDSDEYLVYQDYESRPLRDLITALEKKGIERCTAPMIDAYPAGPLAAARFDGSSDDMPWTVAGLFDGTGYRLGRERRALTMRGGMRVRVFDAVAELIKYPLLYWRKDYSLGVSIHQPVPYQLNFGPIYGALLHFKLFSDAAEMASKAVKDNQYFDDTREYKRIQQMTEGVPGLSLACDISIPYLGSRDLVEKGFLAPVFT
jgi:hypothetical protein